jgi:hypothetical protein
MGFDVIGMKPTNDVGRAFCRNIQAWTPLWSFICQNCDDILTGQQMEEGFANDGVKISARQIKLIVERLQNIVNLKCSMEADKTETMFEKAAHSTLPEVREVLGADSTPTSQNSSGDLMQFLEFARHSGGFRIW